MYLPKPANPKIEGELEMIRNVLMEEFNKYKNEIERENEKERERKKNGENKKEIEKENEKEREKRKSGDNRENKEEDRDGETRKEENKRKERNQEGRNLTMSEKKGIQKLRKRIKEEEIVVLKTDKSGKLVVANKENYLKMGMSKIKEDRERY